MTDTNTEKQSTDLVVVPTKETALQVFQADSGLDPYLNTIREELDKFLGSPPSLDTDKGRKAYASMAHKIARSKTAIDNLGKDLVADLKSLPKKIDAERKRWRDQLDAWRDEARGPLDKWESDEAYRIELHNGKIEWIESWATDRDDNGDRLSSAYLKDALIKVECVKLGDHWEEFETKAARVKEATIDKLTGFVAAQEKYEAEQAELEKLRREQAEREQKERDERIAREAAERATQEAEDRARAELEASARREQAAKEEAERKEQEAKDATARREREHQEAMVKAKVEAELEIQRINEVRRLEEEARIAEQRREEEESARRYADSAHRAAVNRAAVEAMTDNRIPHAIARQIVYMVVRGQIPSMSITY